MEPVKRTVVTGSTIKAGIEAIKKAAEENKARGLPGDALSALAGVVPEDHRIRRVSPVPDDDGTPTTYLEPGMSTRIRCTQCAAVLEEWDAYATHIQEKHANGDDIRLKWAENVLADYHAKQLAEAKAKFAAEQATARKAKEQEQRQARRAEAVLAMARRRKAVKELLIRCVLFWKPAAKPVAAPEPAVIPVPAVVVPPEVLAAKKPETVALNAFIPEAVVMPAPVKKEELPKRPPSPARRTRKQRRTAPAAYDGPRPEHCGQPMWRNGVLANGETRFICRICHAKTPTETVLAPADAQPQPKPEDTDRDAPLCCEGKPMDKVKVTGSKGRSPQQIYRCAVCDRTSVKEVKAPSA